MANTVVTTNGLNFISSAHPDGPLFAIKYWVPVYDWRLDPDIRSDGAGYSATNMAIAEAANRTAPAGEILWNRGIGAYNLSDDINYQFILSGYGDIVNYGTNGDITNSKQTMGPVPINLYVTTPIGDYHKGDKGSFSTITPGTWEATNLEAVYGTNPSYFSNPSYYYKVIDFLPVVETGQTKVKAQFTCRLSEDIGSIKYNKIALYAIRYTGAGVVDSTPHFVGEAYLLSGYPIKKSRFGQGYNETTINVQLEFNMTSAWADVFYGSSADYWSKVSKGLHSSEKISVGTFQNADTEPKATAHFGRVIDENADYENRPNLRLEYIDQNLINNIFDLTVNIFGELEISASNPLTNIHPSSPIEMGSTTYPFGAYIASATHFLNDDLGNSLFESSDFYYDRRSLTIYKRKIDFNDSSDDSYLENNQFAGGDVIRNYHDLILQSKQRSIYIIASVDAETHNLAMSRSVSNNYLYNTVDNYYLTSANTDGASTLFIAAKNGIKSKGPIELEYIPSKNYIDDVLGIGSLNYMTDSGIVYTKNAKMLLIAGANYSTFAIAGSQVNGSSKYFLDYLLYRMSYADFDKYEASFNFDPYFEGYIDVDSEFHLMAYKNIFYGQLLPGSDNNVSIGSNNRRPDIITSKNFNIVYNKNEDGFYSYFKGTYSTVGSPEVDNEINLMMFAALPTANPSVQIPYFSIGEEDPVDRIDTNVLNMVAGTNAAGTNAGIYASDVDMLIRTINALNVDVSNSITSINGYLERGRTKTLGDWKTYTDSTITGLCASLVSSWVNTATISDFKYTIIGKTLIIKYILTFNFKINPTPSGNIYTDLWQLDLSNINILGTLASYSVSRYQIVSSNYVATLTNDKQMFLKIELSTGGILFWSPFGEQADESAILNKDFRFDVQSIYELT